MYALQYTLRLEGKLIGLIRALQFRKIEYI